MSQRTQPGPTDSSIWTLEPATDRAGLSRERPGVPVLFATRNSLQLDVRAQVVPLLNQRLADAIDLEAQCRQAHWNVKGPNFVALHQLFAEVHAAVDRYIDVIAERVTQLGGVAEGTVGIVAKRTTLPEYSLSLYAGADHAAAVADGLAAFGRSVRVAAQEMNALEDADSADLLTEISRGIDRWLWHVEAHLQQRVEAPAVS